VDCWSSGQVDRWKGDRKRGGYVDSWSGGQVTRWTFDQVDR
jgi:hypothetical protein